MNIRLFSLSLLSLAFLSGCASYVTPGSRAELDTLAPMNIREGFQSQPSGAFPASMVAVRLQGEDYKNHRLRRSGGVINAGAYTVILAREVETEEDVRQLAELPQMNDVIALNRMLIPSRIRSFDDLRPGAAKLRADLILVYTFDTRFFKEDDAKPLSVVSLGLMPTRVTTATTTASALLLDTRTGFLYGAFEATAKQDLRSTSWGTKEAADQTRLATEKEAFKGLVEEFSEAWPRIVERYAPENTSVPETSRHQP